MVLATIAILPATGVSAGTNGRISADETVATQTATNEEPAGLLESLLEIVLSIWAADELGPDMDPNGQTSSPPSGSEGATLQVTPDAVSGQLLDL